ncbi:MAG TPA: DUF1801 domain-containing protein [Steroidobacteraceae bacterium]|nr:DUF1801 domain-containing protein [Steroidobacteraceae bacterium]
MPTADEWFADLTAQQRVLLESLRSMILDTHVAIGFQHGAALADPEQLLQGKGRDMRHVRMALGESFDNQAVGALIRDALRHDATISK